MSNQDSKRSGRTDGEAADGDRTIGAGFGRRPVLMALGGGASLALAGTYGSASGDGDDGASENGGDDDGTGADGETTERECPACIDPYSGYLQVAAADSDGDDLGDIDPVATVELRVSDADVVFVEEAGGEPADGTQTPATETATETETETATAMSPTETPGGTPETETTPAETPAPDGADEVVPDFYFDPVGIRLRPGDTVEFVVREDIHTVTAYHPRFFGNQQRVPEGVPGFSSPPFLPDDSWYYRFDEPGVYDMLCLPHEALGMVMRAVVVDDEAEVPEGYPQPEPDAAGPTPIALRVLEAPELDPQNVVDQESVAWTDLTGVESEPPAGPMGP